MNYVHSDGMDYKWGMLWQAQQQAGSATSRLSNDPPRRTSNEQRTTKLKNFES